MIGTSPFTQDFVSLRQAMDRLFDESFVSGPFRTLWSRAGGQYMGLPLDVYATADEAVVVAAVPGVAPDQLDVTINQNTLVLSGQLPNVAESEEGRNATWYLHELPWGTFRRAVTLPFEVDADHAEATFQHGIVRITLPKAEQAKPKKIAIQTGGSAQAIGAGSPASNAS